MSRIQAPVRLKEGQVENFSDFINLLFEYGLFFKWIYFKNRPRGNLLFLRSVMLVGTFSAAFFSFFYDFGLVLEGIEIDPVIALAGAVIVGYWHMTGTFYKKSKSCNQIHLEILKAAGQGDQKTVGLLKNALAIELLTLDLWAHRKFRNSFAENLEDSIDHLFKKADRLAELGVKGSQERFIDDINKGKLQAKQARRILDSYQAHLMSAPKKARKKAAA